MNDDSRYFVEKLSGIEVDSNLITDFPDNAVTGEYSTIAGERKLTGKEDGNTLMLITPSIGDQTTIQGKLQHD